VGLIHNALRRSTLSRALTRAVGDSRGDAGLERYGETLTAVIDLWSQPEWAYLRGETLVGSVTVAAAVVAEFSAVALINPAASGFLVVVERVFAHGSIQTFALGQSTAAPLIATLAAVGSGQIRDRRNRQTANTVGQLLSGSDAGSIAASAELIAAVATTDRVGFESSLPVVLPPGQGLAVQGQTVNLQVIAAFGWRERAVLPGELD